MQLATVKRVTRSRNDAKVLPTRTFETCGRLYLEKLLNETPVIFFLHHTDPSVVVVHLDILRKVSRQYLCDEEPVREVPENPIEFFSCYDTAFVGC